MQLPFATPIQDTGTELIGPLRVPRQMLAAQKYDDHTSIHDNETAQKFGFKGGTIEGPTHFSQFAPLCVALWGPRWLAQGSLSAHYRNACFEGEKVRAFVTKPKDDATHTTIRMEREDGTEILRGTAAIGGNNPPSALEQRISELSPPETPVILRDVHLGLRTKRIAVRMDADQNMGALYPFSLEQKLQAITEPSPWYTAEGAASSPWKEPIIPRGDGQRAAQLFERRGKLSGAQACRRSVRGSGDPHAQRPAVRRPPVRDGSRGGGAQRQSPHRESVDPHARVHGGRR